MDIQLINILWILLCAVLVLLMQVGFLSLESGATRSKNAINVAMKNVADLVLTFLTFWAVGFAIMFGGSWEGFFGQSHFLVEIGQGDSWEAAIFIFQVMFCATAATIISGAVAERLKFTAYLTITLLVVALIYPVQGHWVWGGVLTGTPGWLAEMGFVDFAGSTVVHSTGGWVALATIIVIGPRAGRFENGVQTIPGSNPTLALIGAMFFVLGWIGFNGGSTLALDNSVPGIIANTLLAAVSGSAMAYLAFRFSLKTLYGDHVMVPVNGMLAGMVSITASVHAVTAAEAVLIGAVGALIMLIVDTLMIRIKLDDAIGAVPVHLASGIWGTLCVALFGDPEILATGLDFMRQLQVQATGIAVIGAWSFLVALILIYLINRVRPLRVSREDEYIGLNVAEHNARTETIELLSSMHQAALSADLTSRVPVEPFTEVGQIAAYHNSVMDALEQAIEQTRAIVRDIRDGILTFGKDGLITSFNPGAEKIFGQHAEAVIGQPFAMLVHPEDPAFRECADVTEMHQNCLLRNHKTEMLGQRQGQEPFHMEVTLSEGRFGSNEQFTASIRDISEKRRIEAQLHQERERALITLDSIADGVITTDEHGQIEFMNAAAELLTGWPLKEAQGLAFEDIYQVTDEPSGKPLSDILAVALGRKQHVHDFNTGTYTILSRHNRSFSVQHTAAPLVDQRGSTVGAVIVMHDVTASREMQKKLSHQATHDSLTGLMNRSAFEHEVSELIYHANNFDDTHVLCYLDLDQFKLVNDTCGHIAGDELLRQVSQLIKEQLRSGDTIARLGGDEFGVLLHACPVEHGKVICDNIREAIKAFRFPWEGKQFSIGVSIGIVQIDKHSENLTQLLSWADTACYAAKDLGRNRVHLYEPDDVELAKRQGQMQWVSRIRQALDSDRFRLYFQTIAPIDTNAGLPQHFEIFIRMLDDDGTLIMPGAFIPAAERYNLMQEVDLWVIKNTLAWFGDHVRQLGTSVGVCALNLSGESIGDPACLESIKQYLKRYAIKPEMICFEITETAAIANMREASSFIREMKEIGCKFALDDFGSGLSSFGYLKNLQVDYLKIDGSFIRDILSDSTDQAMVQSINSIGHVMGLKTIAEYVENREIFEMLGSMGIDYVQGYYVDRPRPLEQLDGVHFMPR